MNHAYYIIPTSDKTFAMKYTVDFGFIPSYYSSEFALIEKRGIAIVVKRELEEVAENELEELDKNELSEKYKIIPQIEAKKIREILENGFVSSDRVFESIFKGELSRLIKKTDKFKSNIEISEEELESAKDYFNKEIESAKATVISKTMKLVQESRFIKEADKKATGEKIARGIGNLRIDIVLANEQTRGYSSMAHDDRIVIAHNEDKIKMVNGGKIAGFAQNPDFWLTNKAALFHEIGHRVGDAFGWSFGESFAVRLQEECLKDLGLKLDEERIMSEKKEEEKDEYEGEEEYQGGFKRFDDIVYFSFMENKERFSKLKEHYLKAQDGHEGDKEAAILKMIGNREDTERNLFEYGEVYLDRKWSLSEIFDANAEKCALNRGKEPTVHEVVAFENFFLDESISHEHKGEILAHYLYKRDFSILAIEKIRRHLFSRVESTPKSFLEAEKRELKKIADMKLEFLRNAIESIDAQEKRGHIEYEEESAVKDIAKLSHLLPAYDVRRMIDEYHRILKTKLGYENMKKTALLKHIESVENGSKETGLKENIFDYAREKEKEINLPEHEENREAAERLQECEIVVFDKNKKEEFKMAYNRELEVYEMYETVKGAERKMQFGVKISNRTANAILEAMEEGQEIDKKEFPTKILRSGESEKNIMIKRVAKTRRKAADQSKSPDQKSSRPKNNLP